jgi:hypothetical protein
VICFLNAKGNTPMQINQNLNATHGKHIMYTCSLPDPAMVPVTGREALQHPTHSLNLALSNIHHSSAFMNIGDVTVTVTTWLQALNQDLFVKSFNAWFPT